MVDGKSEIDDSHFFFAPNGKTNAKAELNATIEALLHEKRFDDNSSACRFPARKEWLKNELNITEFPDVECIEYDKIVSRLSPKSATLVFPSAHINSPASMFGHTFIRINSKYKSKLLAYAINYAADADPSKENAIVFSVKGLIGGYYGRYSLLSYYEKLKEYRDGENRDVWEYNLNLNEAEVRQMVRHIWELNGTHSDYYFFTENCSYNMLWLIEVARPSIHLREHFNFEVIPLETIHVAKLEGIINKTSYRPSKRSTLLEYEKLIGSKNIHYVKELVDINTPLEVFMQNKELSKQDKMYILEAAIEFLEYSYSKSKIKKEEYINHFHKLTKQRALLGKGKIVKVKTPANPIKSHRAVRINTGLGYRDENPITFFGARVAYHNLEDSNLGFLRGTEIEFLNFLFSYDIKKYFKVENATVVSIASIAQRSEFFSGLSWRTKLGWDRNYIDEKAKFSTTFGIGYSVGNRALYSYMMLNPLLYAVDGLRSGVGVSLGFVFDKYDFMNTNIEASYREYDTGVNQGLVKVSQSFRFSQNTQLKFKYNYIEKEIESKNSAENTFRVMFNYYF